LIPAYWDSSALVALCVTQPASARFQVWANQFGVVAWWATHTEVYGAIARLHRSNELNDVERLAAIDRLEFLGREWDQIDPIDAVRFEATRVHDRYSLRSADALQLAAALVWCRNRPVGRTFLCADKRLIEAAALAGFAVLGR
jgi:predicted nucleic acid-binding protein